MADVLHPTAWSETDASNSSGTQPSFPENMPGKDVNNAARAMMGALKRWVNQICGTVTSTNVGNAYTISYGVAPEAGSPYNGQRFLWKANAANTGASTVIVNATGAKALKKIVAGAAVDLGSGDIGTNTFIDMIYSGALGWYIWLNAPLTATVIPDASNTVKGIIELATRAEVQAGGSALLGVVPDTLSSLLFKNTTPIPGASSITLGDGGYFEISGTSFSLATIAYTATSAPGRRALLKFTGAGGILVNGANLVLPGAANITVAAGDTCEVVLDSGSIYKVFNYERAAVLSSGSDVQLNKGADQSVISSTALVDCTDLAFTAKAGKTYDIELLLLITYASATGGGLRLMFLPSTSVASSRFLFMKGSDIAATVNDENSNCSVSEQNVFNPSSGETKPMILIKGIVKGGGSDSLIKLQFAQSASDADATTIKADSYLRYKER
jgi:hypothetical protein